jgi:hypothetical protein
MCLWIYAWCCTNYEFGLGKLNLFLVLIYYSEYLWAANKLLFAQIKANSMICALKPEALAYTSIPIEPAPG